MSGSGDGLAVIRRARAGDVGRILDLLAHYDVPRSYFEPFYLRDPTYRPEHSWLAEQDGQLVAHLRVYDRKVRVGGAKLRVAGVGNVITAPEQRGRGYAGQLLEAMLAELPLERFAYSLLRAYRPALYERYGWAPIEEELVSVTLSPDGAGPVSIAAFADEDLPEVMRLYDAANAQRTGTMIRSPEYWRSQLEWLNEDRDGFLVARNQEGALAGYVRSRAGQDAVEILELGLRADDVEVGRALLSAVAARRGGRLRGHLPLSLRESLLSHKREILNEFGLMGRVVDLSALALALEPVWLHRLRTSGGGGGSFSLAAGAGHAEVRVSDEGVRIYPLRAGGAAHALDERAFAHLLFRGYDAAADERLGARPDSALLRGLFPEQDFVLWRADAF